MVRLGAVLAAKKPSLDDARRVVAKAVSRRSRGCRLPRQLVTCVTSQPSVRVGGELPLSMGVSFGVRANHRHDASGLGLSFFYFLMD